MIQSNVRILFILGMAAVMCGTVSAGMGIIAETQETSAGAYPVCTAPCECISESVAAARWGSEGYDRCSKTVCGQSASGSVQYYCLHQVGSSVSSSAITCQAPCECLSDSGATAKWGTNGYTQCSKTSCGRDETNMGSVPRYCYKQWQSTIQVATATTVSAAATQQTVQELAETQVQAPGTSAALPVSPSVSWPAADAVPQKTPVGILTILGAIGTALMAAPGLRKK
jgi:hypothetical protein